MFIRFLYTLLLSLSAPFLMWRLYKKRAGKPSVGNRWKEHFGVTSPLTNSKQPIWIHAVSVGETLAVTPLIKKLKQQYPDQNILITTTTPTGAEQAAKLADIAEHRYMPFDFSFSVRGFIKAVNPSQMLIMETELWPNTVHTVAKMGIPITVINARLSERSYQRYAKFQLVFNLLANNLTKVLCQYPDDAERFIRLGVTREKVAVTGSIKFDIEINPQVKQQGQQLREQLGKNRPVWIAASTHQGEDEQILFAHQEVLKQYSNALLILVPRHPERFNSVFELAKQQFTTVRRTEQNSQVIDENVQVYLGDTMGEMLVLMEAANICFMGGSLLGDKVGGHNMLEPAVLGKPVLTGPSYYNFSEIARILISNNLVRVIENQNQLAEAIIARINKHGQTENLNNYHDILSNYQGGINKTISEIVKNIRP